MNPRAVLEALRQQRGLSQTEYARSLALLGQEGRAEPSATIPVPGRVLHLHGNVAEVLASAGLMEPLCSSFAVQIDESELRRARGELAEHERRVESASWLGTLIDRLRHGLDSGAWQLIPTAPTGQHDDDGRTAPEVEAVRSLLSFEARDGDAIWVDDRCLSGYLHRNGVPIVTLAEVLKALVSKGALQRPDYYSRLTQLRAANVRYLPLEKDELLFNLQEALIVDGVVAETRALAIMRRYVAATLLQGDRLQRPPLAPGAPNEAGEIPYVVSLWRATADSIVDIWRLSRDDRAAAVARCEWVIRNLYLDHLALVAVPGLRAPAPDERRYLFVTSLSGLLLQAIGLETPRAEDGGSLRKDYCRWVYDRLIDPRLPGDPGLLAAVCEALKKSLVGATREVGAKTDTAVATVVVARLYDDLPDPVRNELWRDTDFMAAIGRKPLTAVALRDLVFDAEPYWDAVAAAVNGRDSTVSARNTSDILLVRPRLAADGTSSVVLEDAKTKRSFVLADPGLGVLREAVSDRAAVLRGNRHWFDSPADSFERLVVETASTASPRGRIETLDGWRKQSMAEHYARLRGELSKEATVRFDDLHPPNARALLRHLRLPEDAHIGEPFSDALANAATALSSDEGLVGAVERLAGLPVPMPSALVERFTRSSAREQRELIRHILRWAWSPVAAIHVIRFVATAVRPPRARGVQRLVARLLDRKGRDEFAAFVDLLRWVDGHFWRWPNASSCSPTTRLALVWSHAHRLFATLTSAGAPSKWIRETFHETPPPIAVEVFGGEPEYYGDIAHPSRVARGSFVATGVAYALALEMELLSDGLREDLATEYAVEDETGRHAALELLRDPSLARNNLGSFLALDRQVALSGIVSPENAAQLASSNLHELLGQVVDRLSDSPSDLGDWTRVYLILGDLRPEEPVRTKIRTVLSRVKLADLVRADKVSGMVAVQAATAQAKHVVDSDVRRRLLSELCEVAKLVIEGAATPREGAQDREETARGLILEAARNLAMGAGDVGAAVGEFLSTVDDLAEAFPDLIPSFNALVQQLYEQLPVLHIERAARSLIGFRARRARSG